MANFPIPTSGTAWASGGISGKIGGKSMYRRRRGGIRQKPWNKVTRMEKFWRACAEAKDHEQYYLAKGTNVAVVVANIRGMDVASDAVTSGTFEPALQHAKLHRFQGSILCWLDPGDQQSFVGVTSTDTTHGGVFPEVTPTTPTAGAVPLSNVQLLQYMWMYVQTSANTELDQALLGSSTGQDLNPNWTQDLPTLYARDDVIAMGTVLVKGIVPRLLSQQPATNNYATVVGDAGQYKFESVARIPFPRIPKTGFALKRGRNLVCIAGTMGGGPGGVNSAAYDDSTPDRGVVVVPQYRMLCSI